MAHCLVALVVCREEAPVPRQALASMFEIPDAYLSKQLRQLSRSGLVDSGVGVNGGYTLRRAPEELTLLDVIDVVQGDAPLFECTEVRCRGAFADIADKIRGQGPCGIHQAMIKAEAAWRRDLGKVTIADLAGQIDGPAAQRMRRHVAQHRVR